MESRTFGNWEVTESGSIQSVKYDIDIEPKMIGRSDILTYIIDSDLETNNFLKAALYVAQNFMLKSLAFDI